VRADDVAGNGPGRQYSPRQRMLFNTRDKGSESVSMTWQTVSARPYPPVPLCNNCLLTCLDCNRLRLSPTMDTAETISIMSMSTCNMEDSVRVIASLAICTWYWATP